MRWCRADAATPNLPCPRQGEESKGSVRTPTWVGASWTPAPAHAGEENTGPGPSAKSVQSKVNLSVITTHDYCVIVSSPPRLPRRDYTQRLLRVEHRLYPLLLSRPGYVDDGMLRFFPQVNERVSCGLDLHVLANTAPDPATPPVRSTARARYPSPERQSSSCIPPR